MHQIPEFTASSFEYYHARKWQKRCYYYYYYIIYIAPILEIESERC